MNYGSIRYAIDENAVATITLDRAATHNALNPEMMLELADAFGRVGGDSSVRAVVLSGAGESFCAGGDLRWMESNLDKPRAQRIAESNLLGELFRTVNSCPKLVIARVNGPAYGGGVGLVSACDIAVGIESAMFALSEVKLGLIPANIAPYVLQKMGLAKTRRTALNAMRFNASEAVGLGLLDKVVADDALDTAIEFELKLALAAAPGAIAETKKRLLQLQGGEMQDPARELVEALADVWEGDEAQAGIRAFFSRQKPPWKP